MNKTLKYVFVAGVALGAIAAAILFMKGDDGDEKMTPEKTLTDFYKAVTSGDLDHATGYCDVETMSDYLDKWRGTWTAEQSKDSSALNIASGLLQGIELTMSDISNEGKGRKALTYTIGSGKASKQKKAVIREEEQGKWIIESVIDVI